jgi:serine protease Do
MKRIFFPGMIAFCGLLLSTTGFSQTEKKPITKSEEIIIRTDGDNTTKTIIEIDSNEVTVNGQPLSDYKGDVRIIKRKRITGNRDNFMVRPELNFNWNSNSQRTFLGVLSEKSDKGALIKSITKGSSAEKAGLKENDIITQFGDKKITSPDALADIVKTYKPGDEVKINYLRDGKKKSTKAVLGKTNDFATAYSFNLDSLKMNHFKMPDLPQLRGFADRNFNFYNDNQPKLGIKIKDTEDGNGVKILNVEAGSAAEKAGLKKDDTITELNGEKVGNVNEVRSQLMRSKNKENVSVKVSRDNTDMNFEVKIPKQLKTADL